MSIILWAWLNCFVVQHLTEINSVSARYCAVTKQENGRDAENQLCPLHNSLEMGENKNKVSLPTHMSLMKRTFRK